MDYVFYRDKSKKFECDIKVDGAKISDTKARMILKFEDGMTTMYEGKVSVLGKCTIDIPALTDKIFESTSGQATLEVIADSTVFEPWTSGFSVDRFKKVQVEVVEKEEEDKKPIVEVSIDQNSSQFALQELELRLASMGKKQLRELVREYKDKSLSSKGIMFLKTVLPNDTSRKAQLIGKLYEDFE